MEKRYNPAKPLLFGKSGYYLAKDILCGSAKPPIGKSWPDISLTFQILLLLWTVNLKCSKLDSEKIWEVAEVSIVEIRYIAPVNDKMTISRVYEESWKYTYKGIIPQDYLESIPESRWVANLENSNWSALVCVDNGRIVGTSSFCESRFN